MTALRYADIAGKLDHSLLKPTLTDTELEKGCQLARQYEVASVCIVPHAVPLCVELLEGSGVAPSTTIGFPHGAQDSRAKARESELALAQGATELDMVVNVGKVLSGDYAYVKADISAVLDPTRAAGQKLKVIFENCYLSTAQKLRLCELCSTLGVDWVKTSTGFGTSGATLEDVRLMVANTPALVEVKAAGGIRTLDAALSFHDLGVTRIGTTATATILDEWRRRLAQPQTADR